MAYLSDLWKKGTTAPLADDIPEGGLAIDVANQKAYSKDNAGNIFQIGSEGSIPEAPIDGNLYARLDAAWSNISDDFAKRLRNDQNGEITGNLTVHEFLKVIGVNAALQTSRDDNTSAIAIHHDTTSSHGITGDNFLKIKLFDATGTTVDVDLELSGSDLYINGVKVSKASELNDHINDKNNPHDVDRVDVGLGDVWNADPEAQVANGLPVPPEPSALLRSDSGDFVWDKIRNVSSGVSDANAVPILNSAGKIDPSMLDTSIFYLAGAHDPSAGEEYPDITGHDPGAFWFVHEIVNPDDPTADPLKYTFTSGDLNGKTIKLYDFMVYTASGWSIMGSQMNPLFYLKRDGSTPMVGDLQMGDITTQHKIKYLASGSDATDAINKGQFDSHANDSVKHVTQDDRDNWDSKADGNHNHDTVYLNVSGDSMEGNLAMGGHKITGAASGTANGDVIVYEQIAIGSY